MINTPTDANFQSLVIDDESREFVSSVLRCSQTFMEVMKQVSRIADTNSPVLLTGESGTGKELVAAAIHNRSSRHDHPFVTVNCASTPAEDLFGSFTATDGGTIFLEEITETTPSFQDELLRFLQPGESDPNQMQRVDVRVIAASNRKIEQEVAAEKFSNDLFNYLSAVSIALPPLREHPEDIPSLAQGFADHVYSLSPSVKFSDEALALLEKYNWPGNIRELENAVVHAVAMSEGTIRANDLPEPVRKNGNQSEGDQSITAEPANDDWVTLSVIEGRYVARVLEHTGGNKQAAARVLAVDRKTLDRMIKRHHIDSHHLKALRAKAFSRS